MKKIILILTILCFLFFVYFLVRGFWYAPSDDIPVSSDAGKKILDNPPLVDEAPYRLSIPKLGIAARVIEVGYTKQGNMATPNNYTDVGWFKFGKKPGEIGSAVLAGHVDNGFALPGVFYKLEQIEVGDNIYVTNKKGETIEFLVTQKKLYDYNARADEIFNSDDKPYLKLITCTGTFVKSLGTHDKRLVVTAIENI